MLVSIDVDGRLLDSKRVEIEGGSEYSEVWDMTDEVKVISMRISGQESDYLTLDDQAWAISEDTTRKRVLLVSEGNRFLETVLGLNPGLELFRSDPEEVSIDDLDRSYDLYIFDDVPWPDPAPDGDMLLIRPRPPTASSNDGLAISFSGPFTETDVTRLVESPLHQFVEWSNVNIRVADSISAPWLQPIVEAEGGPLLMVGEQGGRRSAVLTFRLQDSDLPLQVAFPVLMANILDWLNPGQVINESSSLSPGDALVLIPGRTTEIVAVYLPDGGVWVQEVEGDPVSFAQSDQLGVYSIGLRSAAGEEEAGSFAVNLFSDSESNIGPVDQLQFGLMEVDGVGEENVGQRELWPLLAAVALVILIIEWWFYHRGGINLSRFRTET